MGSSHDRFFLGGDRTAQETALADGAMALSPYTATEREADIATEVDHTSFPRGVKEGMLIARGWVVRKGRSVAFLEGGVRKDSKERKEKYSTEPPF